MKKLMLLMLMPFMLACYEHAGSGETQVQVSKILKAQNVKVYRIESSIYMNRHATYFEIDGNKFLMTSRGEVIQIIDAQH